MTPCVCREHFHFVLEGLILPSVFKWSVEIIGWGKELTKNIGAIESLGGGGGTVFVTFLAFAGRDGV